MSIVVGYAPSVQGRAALAAAVADTRRTGSRVVVAAHSYRSQDGEGTVASTEDVTRELRDLGADPAAETVVLGQSAQDGDVGEFLLRVAEEQQAHLIIIGLRRKSPAGKLNLGGAARRVILGSRCPVLAVKDGGRGRRAPAE
ncbi:MAG: universal stress protein [Brachybacterium sp.]|nr:universal stress protein [Brachybacterium sp.]